MDWFEKEFGFTESFNNISKYIKLLEDNTIIHNSKLNTYHNIGKFNVISLKELRNQLPEENGKISFTTIEDDVSKLHQNEKDIVFQVASQFNCLEMISPNITKYDGITRYIDDKTQGPACALATPYSTLYRNYFTSTNTLDEVENILPNKFWSMENGYTIFHKELIPQLNETLMNPGFYDLIEENIKYGILLNADTINGNNISQIFCSAIPVSYNNWDLRLSGFSQLILNAAYEATFILGIITNKPVYITQLGGGAFGNRNSWIRTAINQNIKKYKNYKLSVIEVVYKG